MGKNKSKTEEVEASERIWKWQNKLLPWFIIMPTVLVGVFIYLASQQLIRFNNALETQPDTVLIGKLIPAPQDIPDSILKSQQYLRWITLTKMEQESFYRRYNQGGLLLMSRIYTKYLGFFTGMILAIVGAVFIIGKIREGTSKVSGSVNEMMKFSIVSSSPGIIFGTLGTILMLATILTHNEVMIQDSPLYLNPQTILSTELMSADDGKGLSEKTRNNLKNIYSGKNNQAEKQDKPDTP